MTFEIEGDARIEESSKTVGEKPYLDDSIGFLNETLCEITSVLDPQSDKKQMQRRLLFLTYEAREHLRTIADRNSLELLTAFCNFFFSFKGFRFVDPKAVSQFSIRTHLLSHLFAKKWAAPQITLGVFQGIGHLLGLDFEIIESSAMCHIKWLNNGKAHYLNLYEAGRLLSDEELVSFVTQNTTSKRSDSPTFDHKEFLCHYIEHLRLQLKPLNAKEAEIQLLSLLIQFQPENISLIAQRALIYYGLSDYKNALKDLKRYFSFQNFETSGDYLKNIFEILNTSNPAPPSPPPKEPTPTPEIS